MTAPIDVVLSSTWLGLGGLEKGLVEHALAFDPEVVRARVVTERALGERAATLQAAGIPVSTAHGDPDRMAALLAGAEVVHTFRVGLADAFLPAAVRAAGDTARLVETNVFGHVDSSADEARFDAHLFVSRMCAVRYRERTGQSGAGFHRRHAVSPWPVAVERLTALAADRTAACARLGLDPGRPVVGRVGRADDRKWRRMIVDALPELLRLVPEAQVLLVGATPARVRQLRRLGLAGRVVLAEPTVDEERVAGFYAACDVFLTAAEIGESGSVAIAEAMVCALPVVTSSTPWVDNGQIEQIRHGESGLVANHPTEIAEAVALLLRDPGLAQRMGAAASRAAAPLHDAPARTRALEGLYASLLRDEGIPPGWWPSAAELDAFPGEYVVRSRSHLRLHSRRESAEVTAARVRERAGWALRAARHIDRRTLAFAYWQAKAKVGAGRQPVGRKVPQ